jgi:hypothetical protein
MDQPDAAWGTTRAFQISPPDDDEGTDLEVTSSWYDVVFPNEDGEYHHGSRGAVMPDTVVVRLGDETVALADAFAHTISNEYCYDCEYFLVLRLRTILVDESWRALPWYHLGPGDVFYAWDKFHGHEYSRSPADDSIMSYGGDWSDLQHFIDNEHPRPEGPRPAGPPSATSLLRAVRSRDVATTRALLAAGADPNAGADPPHQALRSVSEDRETTALYEAISLDSAELVEALVAAGARIGPRFPGVSWSALQYALFNRRRAVIPVLLRFGADPDALYNDQTLREVAATMGPEFAALFPPEPPKDPAP